MSQLRSGLACATLCSIIATLMTGCSAQKEELSRAFINEQAWIVNSIGDDISKIVLYAAHKTDPSINLDSIQTNSVVSADGSYTFSTAWNESKNAESKIQLAEHLWDPANYAPLVKTLAGQLHLAEKQSATDNSDKLIKELGDFTPSSIANSNHAVSQALADNPLAAEPNEESALICALYGLRETAGRFSDRRLWLNRISAHLSIAEAALNGKPLSPAGELSKAILLCLEGRTTESLALVEKLKKNTQSTALQSWLRAIQMRATHDYRLADLHHANVVEQLEYGRCMANNLGADSITDYLNNSVTKTSGAKSLIDWSRIAIHSEPSVEAGHIYYQPSESNEIADFAKDLKIYQSAAPHDEKSLIQQLANRPTGCLVKDGTWQLQPVSINDLCAYHGRHVLESVDRTYYFLKHIWGLRNESKEYFERANRTFGDLPTYPLHQLTMLDQDNQKTIDPNLMISVGKLALKSPEVIPYSVWKVASRHATPDMLDSPGSWFAPPIPIGTTYDFDNRFAPGLFGLAQLEKLKALNPYDLMIIDYYVSAKYDTLYPHVPLGAKYYELLTATLGPLLDYDIASMKMLASNYWRDDRTKYGPILERICRIKPDNYYVLGE